MNVYMPRRVIVMCSCEDILTCAHPWPERRLVLDKVNKIAQA